MKNRILSVFNNKKKYIISKFLILTFLVILFCVDNIYSTNIFWPKSHPSNAIVGKNWYGWPEGSDPSLGGLFNIYIWKEKNYIWLEIEPITKPVSIDGITIIQNNKQYDMYIGFSLKTGPNPLIVYYGEDFYVNTILRLSKSEMLSSDFSLDKPFSLIYQGLGDIYKIDIDFSREKDTGTEKTDNTENIKDMHSQDYINGFNAGKQYCVTHPEECGIDLSIYTSHYDFLNSKIIIPSILINNVEYSLTLELYDILNDDSILFKVSNINKK